MCDPVSLIAAASLASGAVGLANTLDAKKQRKQAAAEAKANADNQRRTADLEAKGARDDAFSSRRAASASSAPGKAGFGSLFSSRSFFQAS